MTTSDQNTLDTIGSVLIRCGIITAATLMIWVVVLSFAGDWVYKMHSGMFSALTREAFDAIHYGGMALLKTALGVLFVFPYIAIRLMRRKAS